MQKLQKHDVGVFTTDDLSKLFEDDELTAQRREKLKRVISTDQAGRFALKSFKIQQNLLQNLLLYKCC